jgi:hypothetical protein
MTMLHRIMIEEHGVILLDAAVRFQMTGTVGESTSSIVGRRHTGTFSLCRHPWPTSVYERIDHLTVLAGAKGAHE